jgi:hypothetical protein
MDLFARKYIFSKQTAFRGCIQMFIYYKVWTTHSCSPHHNLFSNETSQNEFLREPNPWILTVYLGSLKVQRSMTKNNYLCISSRQNSIAQQRFCIMSFYLVSCNSLISIQKYNKMHQCSDTDHVASFISQLVNQAHTGTAWYWRVL